MKTKHCFFTRGYFRKFFVVMFLVVYFQPTCVRAGYWGEGFAANMMLFNLETISYRIQGIVLSAVKTTAIQVINQKVLSMINGGGASGASLIIQDWKNFILIQSAQKAQDVILNDFFPDVFQGKGSGGNYVSASEGVFSGGSGAFNYADIASLSNTNYPEYLSSVGKQVLKNELDGVINYTLDNVCSNPAESIDRGDYECLREFMSPQNNPFGIPILTQQKYNQELEENKLIAQTQAGITGYKPQVNSSGLVVTPPQTISDIVSTMQTLSAKAIATIQNPSELITGIAQAYVNKMIQQTLSNVGLSGSVGQTFANNLGAGLSAESNALIEENVGAVFNSSNASIYENNMGNLANYKSIQQIAN